MPEPQVVKFSFQELGSLMVRQANIKEGLWSIYVRFGIAGANTGPDEKTMYPTAIVPVMEVGLQKAEQPGPLVVDAADVWKK